MAKSNTKYSQKIDKKKLSKQLEVISNNVARKAMFFSAKNAFESYDIVDARTQKPIIKDVPIHELAQICANTLNRIDKPRVNNKISHIQRHLHKHRSELEKHHTDIVFYKNTMSTTTDDMRYFIVESRLDVSTHRLSNLVNKLRHIFS
jgi:hypothetical protein